MTDQKEFYINIIVHTTLVLLFTGFQTSLWFDFFASFPAPFFWISFVVYFALNKKLNLAITLLLLNSILLSNFSLTPPGYLVSISFVLFYFTRNLKSRLYWEGVSYFILLVLINVFLFHLLYNFSAMIFEDIRFSHINWLHWPLQNLITALFAPIMLIVLKLTDYLIESNKDTKMENVF